jgi:flap endonuclease-1
MGLSALRDVLDPEPFDLAELEGRRVAVDANNLLWAFVKAMARGGPPEGPHGRPVSHVIGLVNRLELYARLRVEPVWVFDGEPPELKAKTIEKRQAQREKAREEGDEVGAARLEDSQIREAKTLLDTLGVPWFQAPEETDAQLAWWVANDHVDAGITQDYDAALYGCPTTLRYVRASGNRDPERITLERRLAEHEITRQQLVDAAILIGTDYNDGVHGVGPVRGLDLVREHGDLQAAAQAREAELPRAEAVRELFLDPTVAEQPPPGASAPDPPAARSQLARHGLAKSRAKRLVQGLGQPLAADTREA